MIASQNYEDRIWQALFRRRWAIAASLAAVLMLIVWKRQALASFAWVPPGVAGVWPFLLLLPLMLAVALMWIKAGSRLEIALSQADLRQELRQKLAGVSGWDEFAAILLDFLKVRVPLAGLRLYLYDPASGEEKWVADGTAGQKDGLRSLDLDLGFDNQRTGKLKLQLGPGATPLPKHLESLREILPEVSYAVEHARLQLADSERITALQQVANTRMARDLHDILGDNLAYLRMKLEHIAEQSGFEKNAELKTELRQIREVADETYERIRGLLSELQVGVSSDFSGSIQECIALAESRSRFRVSYESQGQPRQLPYEVQRQILFLVREILRNAEKHALARQVSLKLVWGDTGLAIEAADDGRGFDIVAAKRKDGHYGLKIMQEIADDLNGQLEIRSAAGNGAQVSLWIPYEPGGEVP